VSEQAAAGTPRTLVLGGGGITGIAWEIGLLTGLAGEGVDLTTADLVLGTSAGSVVGAQVTSGVPLDELFEAQVAGYGQEVAARMGVGLRLRFAGALLSTRDETRFRRKMGRLALRAKTMSEADRLAVIESRLPRHEWPDRDLRLTVVDAESGELRVLDRTSGVPLVRAVAASCAVPGVYPPIGIDGRRYVDGGVRSGTNADLAAGSDRVVILAPVARGVGPMLGVPAHLDLLRLTGRAVAVSPDETAVKAIGRNMLDPAQRAAAARAGRAQAATARAEIAALWAD